MNVVKILQDLSMVERYIFHLLSLNYFLTHIVLHRILLYVILRHKCCNLLLRFITLSPHLVIPSQYKNG